MKYFLCKFGLSFSGGARVICDNEKASTSSTFRQLVVTDNDDAALALTEMNGSKVVEELTYEEAQEFVNANVNENRTYLEPVYQYEKNEQDETVLDESGNPVMVRDEEGNPIVEEEIERERPLYTLPTA